MQIYLYVGLGLFFASSVALLLRSKSLSSDKQKLHVALQELQNIKQNQDIQMAVLEEKANTLPLMQDEINHLKTTLESVKLQEQNLHVELSEYKISLQKQNQKYSEFEDSTKKREDELKDELQKEKQTSFNYNEEIKEYKSQISQLQTQLEEQNNAMQDKLKLLQENEQKLKVEFENLANKIFSDNSKKFSEQNQKDLGLILNPMRQQLGEFKKKVEDVYDKEAKDRSALQNELKTLKELNHKMSQEAHKLTTALTSDNKTQGNWGEMILDNVLESSGLRLGHEYEKQLHLKDDEDKAFKPDVVVHLPDDRDLIIDAKTSLKSYNEYMTEVDEELKTIHLKNHIRSIKEHIKGLADKKYEDLKGVNTLDFIFMFLPIEGALLLALENDVNLYDEAFKQKIILVSPTTLLVALRAVENTWRYERQAQNIVDVYYRAEELYKKFNGFIEDMKKVGKGLDNANETYNEAFKKLTGGRGNLISQVTMLKKVSNIKPKKEIDSTLVENSMIDEAN